MDLDPRQRARPGERRCAFPGLSRGEWLQRRLWRDVESGAQGDCLQNQDLRGKLLELFRSEKSLYVDLLLVSFAMETTEALAPLCGLCWISIHLYEGRDYEDET